MKIHAVQLDIVWENRESNHRKVRDLVASANVRDGEVIVLPEMFDVGFSMNSSVTAQGTDAIAEKFLAELAAETGCCVIGGVVSSSSSVAGKPFNEAVAVAPDGEILSRYQKQRPFTHGKEHENYASGSGHEIFNWGGVRFALNICYDLRFPELYRPAALAGAEVLVTIANWPSKRSEHWVRLLQARAIENLSYALGVNRCGEDPNLVYDGRTSMFDPHGTCVFECGVEEQIATAELDIEELRSWRDHFPALRDAVDYGGHAF